MGGLLHLVQRGRDWARLAVPTAHLSSASVPITVLLYKRSTAVRFYWVNMNCVVDSLWPQDDESSDENGSDEGLISA